MEVPASHALKSNGTSAQKTAEVEAMKEELGAVAETMPQMAKKLAGSESFQDAAANSTSIFTFGIWAAVGGSPEDPCANSGSTRRNPDKMTLCSERVI